MRTPPKHAPRGAGFAVIACTFAMPLGPGVSSAAGAPIGFGKPQVGPALTDGGVVFGERAGRRGIRLVAMDPSGNRVVRFRRKAPKRRRSSWAFSGRLGALAASGSQLAFITDFNTIVDRGSDYVVTNTRTSLLAGPTGGPFDLVSGGRASGAHCAPLGRSPDSVDVDGTNTAFEELPPDCDQPSSGARVVVRDAAGATLATFDGARGTFTRVRIAGPYVGWLDGEIGGARDRLIVAEIASGREVLRLSAPGRGIRYFDDFALQPDGKVALLYAPRRLDTVKHRLAWISPDQPRLHRLTSRAGEHQVEFAGDRVAFMRYRTRWREELVISGLDGQEQVIARFGRRRQRLGDFDFDGSRVSWAAIRTKRRRYGWEEPKPIGPGRVFVEALD